MLEMAALDSYGTIGYLRPGPEPPDWEAPGIFSWPPRPNKLPFGHRTSAMLEDVLECRFGATGCEHDQNKNYNNRANLTLLKEAR